MKLQKVNIIGKKYVHRFLKDDKTEYFDVECTQRDYQALALPNAVNPEKAGYTWIWSAERLKYDTASGDIENGQYADYPLVVVKTEGFHESNIETQNIVADEISDEALSKFVMLEPKSENLPVKKDV